MAVIARVTDPGFLYHDRPQPASPHLALNFIQGYVLLGGCARLLHREARSLDAAIFQPAILLRGPMHDAVRLLERCYLCGRHSFLAPSRF